MFAKLTIRRTFKMFITVAAVSALMFCLCSCGENTDNTSNDNNSNEASTSASAPSSQSTSNSNIGTSSQPGIRVDENTGRDTMPESYVPGVVSDGVYVNDVAKIKFAIPGNFEILANDKPNQELNLIDDTGKMKVVIAYATDGILDDFVTATYAHYKQQENPAYQFQANIADLQIAGENRHVITTQMTNDGTTSSTAMVFFEGNGHIIAVTATTEDVNAAIGLIALTEQM